MDADHLSENRKLPSMFVSIEGSFFKSIGSSSFHLAGHDEQRAHFETGVVGAQPICVVVLFDVDHFLGLGDHINRHIIIAAIA